MTSTSGAGVPAPKRLSAENLDLMKPGNGIPWEDRGSIGAVPAYVKTAFKSLFSPSLMLDHISRTESTTDATGFAAISSVLWGVGVLAWNGAWLYMYLPDSGLRVMDPMYYWITAVLQAALVGAGVFAWMSVGSKMYLSLSATELKRVRLTLIINCFSYALGPSLVALVPVAGWPLAFVWILWIQIVAGRKRLYMKNASAIVNPLIIAFCVLASTAVLYFFLGWLWCTHLDMSGLAPKPPPRKVIPGNPLQPRLTPGDVPGSVPGMRPVPGQPTPPPRPS